MTPKPYKYEKKMVVDCFSLRPDQKEYLKSFSNASELIRELIDERMASELDESNPLAIGNEVERLKAERWKLIDSLLVDEIAELEAFEGAEKVLLEDMGELLLLQILDPFLYEKLSFLSFRDALEIAARHGIEPNEAGVLVMTGDAKAELFQLLRRRLMMNRRTNEYLQSRVSEIEGEIERLEALR